MAKIDCSAAARTLAGFVACTLWTLSGCSSPSPLAPEAIDALRQAAHRRDWERLLAEGSGVLLKGEARFLGRLEAFEFLLAADGRYRYSVAGPLGKVEAFDGQRVVRRDASGIARELDLGDLAEAPLLASLMSGAWVDGADLRLRESEPGELVVDRPGTPLEFGLLLDPKTQLPVCLVERTSSGQARTQFTDWAFVGGAPLPFFFHAAAKDGTPFDMGESYRVTQASVVQLTLANFTLETDLPTDFHFDTQRGAALETIRTTTGHLLVRPLVDGQDLGWFLLDSGAGAMALDGRVVGALDLLHLGNVRAVGAVGNAASRFVQGRTIEVGPMTFDAPIFVEVNLEFLEQTLGVEVAGVIGYDVFSRSVIEIDHDQVRIFDPQTYSPEAKWSRVPLAFQNKTPCAVARFPTSARSVEGWFRIDTGANGAVTFHAPAVRRYRLLAQHDTTLANFGGIGGGTTGYFAELAWFEFAGRRSKAFEAGFAMSNAGTFGDAYTAGNLGQGLFEGARLIFDYSRELLYLAPSLGGK